MSATTSVIVLNVGDRFLHHGNVYTVEAVHAAADRYDLSATFRRRPCTGPDGKPRNFRWAIGYVAHLLETERARLNPTERCDLCGEPEGGEMAEIVSGARHLVVHVGCAEQHAVNRGKRLADILA